MRIGVDALAIQSPFSRGRGIGRYARSLLAAMLEADRANEYVLYTYEDLPRDALPTSSRTTIREVRRELGREEHTLQHAIERALREDAGRLDLDWFLLLSPFETWQFYGLPHRPVGRTRAAAVVYDVIPFLFQETYLTSEEVGRWFYGHLGRLARYDRFLAISEATRLDTIRLLGLPPDRVHAIGTASESPRDPGGDPARDAAVLDRLGIDRPFLFCLGSSDPRKNLRGLIDAFALLPARQRSATQLVVTCSLIEKEIHQLRDHAKAAGIDDRLVLTNSVGQDELDTLYRRCAAFVFPSLYEGFGLPILEAMQLGAPVVAADNSSQPEVVGDAGLLANAAEPGDLAAHLERLLDDPALRRRLGAQGRARSEQFRWDDVADRALRALDDGRRPRIVGGSTSRGIGPPGRPRIAMFSPLPPVQSGIARYAERVCESLREDALIDLYHAPDDRPVLADASSRFACLDASTFERRRALLGYESVVYQFGNSSYHAYLYETFLKHPGVAVLHDHALPGFHASFGLIAGRMNAHLVEELSYSGQARDPELVGLVAGWVPGTWDLQEEMVRRGVTMNRRILERATGVIVHSEDSKGRIASAYPWLAAKVHVAPIGCDAAPIGPGPRREARRALGVEDGAVVIGAVGILHPTKLNREAVRAFAGSLGDDPGAVLVFLGRDLGGGEAAREADRLGVADRVRFLGHLPDEEYERAIAAFDVGLCLRRPPTNGESSAALLDLLRRGLPTIVCDVGTFAGYPRDAVIKIAWNDEASGIAQLGAAMRMAVLDDERRARVGRGALAYARAEHSWDRLIDAYRGLCLPRSPRVVGEGVA
ncbi:glycosyltransferase [Tautonia plasticadhaerens]|uniref:Capsular glucan synthase n=1 Tax=Tautonia plasticadhaerens TaxID=2527974 RepID=A0A518H4J6_9BACT|nr:glycosyltransferase [Tautonia plasticadhaerens]QDV35765.1 Capsular glucan synthase [Tautonia plasticadhaerens]